MAFASVRVATPVKRLIYVNSNYARAVGRSPDATFVVPAGPNTAETLNANREVDFRLDFIVEPRDTDLVIDLEPVDPPEPIAGGGGV